MRKYYEAYDERYRTCHQKGFSWEYMKSTPIVLEMISRLSIPKDKRILEIGCGEGRDAREVLRAGYDLLAVDISQEAITYCKKTIVGFDDHFLVLNCLEDELDGRFGFIYSVAVIHMLVLDEDRDKYYSFVRDHLEKEGLALICSMGDGDTEMRSDIEAAFENQQRNHYSGKMTVAATSCRMVSFKTFENEISRNGLEVVEKGITPSMPNFNSLMYALVRRS